MYFRSIFSFVRPFFSRPSRDLGRPMVDHTNANVYLRSFHKYGDYVSNVSRKIGYDPRKYVCGVWDSSRQPLYDVGYEYSTD